MDRISSSRLRALGPHAAVARSLRVLMRQVHSAPVPSLRRSSSRPGILHHFLHLDGLLPLIHVSPFQHFAHQHHQQVNSASRSRLCLPTPMTTPERMHFHARWWFLP